MHRPPPLPRSVVVGLALAIVLDTVVQLAWKLGVAGAAPAAGPGAILRWALGSPWFYVAMAAFVAQLANWLRVLARADLSFAQPFTALSYVSVLTLSSHSLHESLSAAKLAGVALIFVGVACISRTPSRTSAAP